MEKRNKASSTNGAGLTGCLHEDECKQIYIYHPAQNMHKDLNIKTDTLKLLEEKVENTLDIMVQ